MYSTVFALLFLDRKLLDAKFGSAFEQEPPMWSFIKIFPVVLELFYEGRKADKQIMHIQKHRCGGPNRIFFSNIIANAAYRFCFCRWWTYNRLFALKHNAKMTHEIIPPRIFHLRIGWRSAVRRLIGHQSQFKLNILPLLGQEHVSSSP
jgi:hypothetical protein